jgi:hypothetical protein
MIGFKCSKCGIISQIHEKESIIDQMVIENQEIGLNDEWEAKKLARLEETK